MATEEVTAERLDELLSDESIPLPHRALWLALWDGGTVEMAPQGSRWRDGERGVLRLDVLLGLDARDMQGMTRGVWVRAQTKGEDGRVTTLDVDLEPRTDSLLREAGYRGEGPLLVGADGGRMTKREAVEQARAAGVSIDAFRAGGMAARHAPAEVG
jgi:hypothetical protein